jgi:Holliday junction DNA helicase RuvA
MIGLLTGTVYQKLKNPIILMVGGVGYCVHVPPNVLNVLTQDATHTLFIHTHVRDDALDLYGFSSQDQLDLFTLLLTVSGIGPRTALAIIDRGAPEIYKAIAKGDVDFFTTIPRLGKKNAQKIIIELKSKLGSIGDLDLSEDISGQTGQLLDALMAMGFARKEAIVAIKKLTTSEQTLEQKIRKSLQFLGRNNS